MRSHQSHTLIIIDLIWSVCTSKDISQIKLRKMKQYVSIMASNHQYWKVETRCGLSVDRLS